MTEYLDHRRARDISDRAKAREIAAHRHAIVLHERAARMFEGQGDIFSAGRARARGQRALDKLEKALAEQQRQPSRPANRSRLGLSRA